MRTITGYRVGVECCALHIMLLFCRPRIFFLFFFFRDLFVVVVVVVVFLHHAERRVTTYS